MAQRARMKRINRISRISRISRIERMNLHAALMTVMLTAAAITGAAAPAAAQSVPPADDAAARVRLEESSRHGEYVDIAVPGQAMPVRAFVVYPEIATKAAVIVVVHDAPKLSDWVRGVADQVAADGFIAIAPELPSGATAKDPAPQAVHAYGAKLPASTGKTTTLLLHGAPRPESWAAIIAGLRTQTQ
jgi:hypothetical protein